MRRDYPNLELLEYKAKEYAFAIHQNVLHDAVYPTIKADVFMQTWANTATGFDADGVVSGQAFTDEYTTVMEMSWCKRDVAKFIIDVSDKIYIVFFGNRLAYMYLNPNKQFFEDLKNRNMKSQKESKEYL